MVASAARGIFLILCREELMNRFRKLLTLAASLAGFAMAGLAPPARADFEVVFSYNGATVTIDETSASTGTATATGGASLSGVTINGTALSGTSGTFTFVSDRISISNLTVDPNASKDGNSGGFNINASVAKSNSPGTTAVATISTSGLLIANQTGVNGNSSLVVTTGSQGFTAPTGNPVNLNSTASASADGANSGNASLVFNSYLNENNALLGTTVGSPTINLSPITPGASMSANSYALVNANVTPYSLVQVGKYTLGNGDDFFDGSTGTSVTATPAPAGLMLALTGLPCLGFGSWLWRRKLSIA
jgi:hypothetical protein